MPRIPFCSVLRLVVLAGLGFCTTSNGEVVTGHVFDDVNSNGVLDAGEAGVPQVGVSDGISVVSTDDAGRYSLEIKGDATIFVIKPSHWQIALDPKTTLPRHYYTHRPNGSPSTKFAGVAPTGPLPESVDFPLVKHPEDAPFNVVCFGDTQPRNQTEVDYISHDVVEELIGVDAAFGFTLGDLVFDNLAMQPEIAQGLGVLGLPWYHVIGNHDINYDTADYAYEAETYTRVFGPPYYSFNHGKVHFIALNDIYWDVEKKRYHGELGADQLAFIKADLARVPKDYLIVPLMHIPLQDVVDRDQLFALLEPFEKTFSIAAHWHRQEHFFMGEDEGWHGAEKHHHLVQGTACGAWWSGNFDELGIPHTTMSDGTPNGHAIIRFDGTDYQVRYKASRRPASYQMNIAAPEAITTASSGETEVVANIFGGSEKSTVRLRLRGSDTWYPMTQYTGTPPYVAAHAERERGLAKHLAKLSGIEEPDDDELKKLYNTVTQFTGPRSSAPRETAHLWKGLLPPSMPVGYHVIEIETADGFGQKFVGHRVVRVVPVP